jgi:putative colanic acid biosynthesis UDP-glucose lipid carrier transferase
LNTTSAHKLAAEPAVSSWQSSYKNGIVRSTVAMRKNYLLFKRGFDILFSLAMILLVLSWLIPLVGILIKIDSPGPIFFRQKRIGKKGRTFHCLKFRTMVPNEWADEQPATPEDDRITRLGKILRRSNLDEFPQFLNILVGDMSVVGPRPHMISDCIRFSFVVPSYHFRSLLKPGITGWAQVNGYHGVFQDYESIIIRYYWDAQYVRKAAIWLDLRIIFSTFLNGFGNLFAVIFRR